jgi:peptidoglycan hydrolase-like protein with peptidoglycan-binding domain
MNENESKLDETPINADKPAVEEVPTVVTEKVEKVEKVEKQEAPAPRKNSAPPAAKNAAVSGGAVDEVLLSKCVYRNAFARKSLSVHHVQRRLVEWGYRDAGSDKDGWYGDLTKAAVAAFQKAHGLEGAGIINAATLVALFDGDENVHVVA